MAEEARDAKVQEQAQEGTQARNGNGTAPAAAAPAPAAAAAPPPPPSGLSGARKRVAAAVAAVMVLAGGIAGTRYWLWARDHVSTDDAFVTGNLVNVSPPIAGTVSEILVAEGDKVRKGQLLARLEDSQQRAALRQAQAAYEAALSRVPQAESSLAYQQATAEAAIQKARAAIATQSARTEGAGAQLALARGTTVSEVQRAESQVRQALAQAAQAQAQVATAEAAVRAARQGVSTAEKGVGALAARLTAASAEVTRAERDEARYRKLLAAEAVTQQQYDAVQAGAESARSALANLQEQVAQARSQVEQARAEVARAEAQAQAARQAAAAARQQVEVARSGVAVARANAGQVGVQSSNVAASAEQQGQAEADLSAALAERTQVALRRQEITTARADARRALAALKTAQVAEQDTYLYAPADGVVVRKAVNPGTSVASGQTLMTLAEGGPVWITANFKETQLGHVRIGQPVDVEVDAFPGKRFRAVVATINAATGAATSLLPPDNATGNFTKVVQRIPVRIALLPGSGPGEATAEDIARLRQGMSTVVTVETTDPNDHPERVPAGFDRTAASAAAPPLAAAAGTGGSAREGSHR